MRSLRTALVASVAALVVIAPTAAAPSASPATAGAFTHRGTVTRVVDGDTIDVRLTSGKRERVRLIGIDTPESGACHASIASARVSSHSWKRLC